MVIINKKGIATGLDINAEALEIANLTLKENNFQAKLINADFKTYVSDEKYDVIVSNPPYFDTKDDRKKNQNYHLKIARHEEYLPLKNLCESFKKNLNENGNIYLVYRPSRLNELEKNLNENNLFINHFQFVYDYRKSEAKSVLVHASFKNTNKIQLENKIIGD